MPSSVETPKLPALFVSHGAPLFAVEAGTTGPALAAWGRSLAPDIRAVVVMSPHWMAASPAVMTTAQPATWHDFGGFPQALYALKYPAPGSTGLGQRLIELLSACNIAAASDSTRPFDHGAWVPLLHMLPQADIPVVQVALPQSAGPHEVYAIGAAFQSLRQEGILVMGSGSMTHNLSEFFGGAHAPQPYVLEFSRWVESRLMAGDVQSLLNYRKLAPHAVRAHPTEDHLLPLFFVLGAAGPDTRPTYLSREVMYGILAMDAFELH